jgi:copper ion binding protein
MKQFILTVLMILVITACSQSGKRTDENGQEPQIEIATENLVQISFDVKGMTCEGCENAIVTSIGKLDGIKEATASHTEHVTVVSFDASKTDTDAISKAINDAGYEVLGHDL